MYRGKTIAALIVAAGQGTRMGATIPKQFLKINDRGIGFLAADVFHGMEIIDQLIFITQREYLNYSQQQLPYARVVEGGNSRSESVWKGLCQLSSSVDFVLVHDGARPFVQPEIIRRVLEGAFEKKAAICAVSPKDTIRNHRGTLNRDELYCVQTPQGFERTLLVQAYEQGGKKGFKGTDDASFVEALGHSVAIVEGSYTNIKVTTKEDLPMETKVGMGYDVHRLVSGRPLILGGVTIPWEKGLLGHSDADVLIHSIMDALLGALGQGDIGQWFPDTEEQYKDAFSINLLTQVGEKVKAQGYCIENIDVTVMAQRPKILPYAEEMKKNISNALQISKNRINIKGTTTEGLGFIGREEGLAAQALCTIKR